MLDFNLSIFVDQEGWVLKATRVEEQQLRALASTGRKEANDTRDHIKNANDPTYVFAQDLVRQLHNFTTI